jgi:hypothetical protein
LACLCFRQNQTIRPMSSPMPSATPTTIPTTVPLLMPPDLTELCPRVGSAVAAGGVLIMVLTWPVTVVIIVTASVATGVMPELGGGLGLGVGVGDGEVANVLDWACTTLMSAQFSKKVAIPKSHFRREDAVEEMRSPYSGRADGG